MAEFIESLLPSGRGIRIEKIKTKQYREATKRAAAKDPVSGAMYAEELGLELLLIALRATTPTPVDPVFTDAGKGNIDLDAMLGAVSPNAWTPHTYQSLVTDGPTSLDEVLSDPIDYTAARVFAQSAVDGASPLGRKLTTARRTVVTDG